MTQVTSYNEDGQLEIKRDGHLIVKFDTSEPVEIKPNYDIVFHRREKELGRLDFNGPKLVFTGEAEESAKVLIEVVAETFVGRLAQEREPLEKRVLELESALREARDSVQHIIDEAKLTSSQYEVCRGAIANIDALLPPK